MSEPHPDRAASLSRSRRLRLLVATLLLVVATPCLCLGASAAYLKLRNYGTFSRWRSLGAPPGGGVDILTADHATVYVQTSSGEVFRCRHIGRSSADECWVPAQEPYDVDRKTRFDAPGFQGSVEPPRGQVLDMLVATVWHAEDVYETRYALLSDGTIWAWRYDVGAYWSLLILIAGPAVGLLLGTAAAALLWLRTGLQLRRRRE